MSKFVVLNNHINKRGHFYAINVYGNGSEEDFNYELQETIEILTCRYGIAKCHIDRHDEGMNKDSFRHASRILVYGIQDYYKNINKFYEGLSDSQKMF